MTSAWPHQLGLKRAAEFCDMSAAAFLTEIAPRIKPTVIRGRDYWLRDRLARHLEAMHDGRPTGSPMEAIRAAGKAERGQRETAR